jgi:hypothetical protein
MKRLGPELKMPELKAPTFLVDLWWDLWDRRLLPLVALIVVAIVAVPFLMGGGSKAVPPPLAASLAAGAGAPGPASAGSSDLAVVEAKPGLRDYHRRLARRSPTDPFVQRFTAPVLTGAELSHQSESSTSSTITTTTTSPTGGGGESGSGSSGHSTSEPVSSGPSSQEGKTTGGAPSSGGTAKPHLVFFAFAINVKITRWGGQEAAAEQGEQKPERSIKKRVMPLTPLPGEKAPVVTYMGPSGKKGKLLLLVSNEVRSTSGEATCAVSGASVCQLLEVEPGFPVSFVYGANEVHYTFNVLKVELVVTGHA